MDIELDSVPVPSDYIELLEKHYDEVGPNLQYLVEWFTIRQRLPIILDLTIQYVLNWANLIQRKTSGALI